MRRWGGVFIIIVKKVFITCCLPDREPPESFFLEAGSWSLLINSFFNFVSLSPLGSNFFLPIFWKESFKIPKCQWSVGSWESTISKSRESDLEVRQGYKVLKPSPQESTSSRRLHPPSRSSTTSRNSTTNLVPAIQISEPMEDISHSNHHTSPYHAGMFYCPFFPHSVSNIAFTCDM